MKIIRIVLPILIVLSIVLGLKLAGVFDTKVTTVTTSPLPPTTQSAAQPATTPQTPTTTTPKFKPLTQTYRSEIYNYTINYPNDWSVNTTQIESIMLMSTEKNSPGINIRISNKNTYSVEERFYAYSDYIKSKYTSLNIIDSEKLSGSWDYHYIFELVNQNNATLKVEGFLKLTSTNLYWLEIACVKSTYQNYPIQEIIDSFQLIVK